MIVQLILITFFAAPIFGGESSQHYDIVPVNSTDLCRLRENQLRSCLTLDQLSSQFGQIQTDRQENITFNFFPGNHLLTWDLSISGANEVIFSSTTLKNYPITLPRITCSEEKGISVEDTLSLTMKGLEIYQCVRQGSAPIQVKSLWTSVNAVVQHCIFTGNLAKDANGGALSIVGNAASLRIDSSIFQLNEVTGRSGGALDFSVFFNGRAKITNTSFVGNKALGRTGGAVVYYGQTLTISKSMFINNTAYQGGALDFLEGTLYSSFNVYKNNSALHIGGALSSLTTAVFTGDIFRNNQAPQGAAAYFDGKNTTTFAKCSFSKNSGGDSAVFFNRGNVRFKNYNVFELNQGSLYAVDSLVSFSGKTQIMNNTGNSQGSFTSVSSSITFERSSETVISGNKAIKGAGIFLKQSTLSLFGNILITRNVAEIAGGGIFAFHSSMLFGENFRVNDASYGNKSVIISHNEAKNGGGMYLSVSTASHSYGTTSIFDNKATQFGGGIFFESNSAVTINNNVYWKDVYVSLKFNSAVKGGGIYIADVDDGRCVNEEENGCFLQTISYYMMIVNPETLSAAKHNEYSPIVMDFVSNTANDTGNDIYGGLLDRCTVSLISAVYTNVKYNATGSFLMHVLMDFNWNQQSQVNTSITNRNALNCRDHISSDPVRVCFCDADTFQCNSSNPTVYKKKGERFTLSLVAVDQIGNPVNATLISTLTESQSGQVGRLKEGQQLRKISDYCTDLEYNVYSSDSNEKIELYADGPCKNRGISRQEVNITFLPCTCPVGLERVPPEIDCKCDCDRKLSHYISDCSAENETVQINSNIWIKYVNSANLTDYATHECTFDYCVVRPVTLSLVDQDKQCAFNRTGILCGECKEGLSLVFASSDCQHCSNYYLFLLLPFGLAGIALVTFILILNMTVAAGTIHGLIFYANILAANRSIFIPFDTPNVLTVFVSWLNLDLGIKTCFYSGMDSYGKLLLQLVFPAYVFFLIAIIMILCNRSQRIAQLLGKRNPEATLYTLIFLSYYKLIRLIITALQFTTINYPDGSLEILWRYDANVLYFSVSHIPRFLIATVIILMGTVYITLLLFGQLFNHCSEHRVMKWTTHKYYIHFMKAHHAPLSDTHRYWVGLLLLTRLVHYLISAFVTDSIIILSATLLSFILILYKQLMSGTIYQAKWLDLLETSFLVNLNILGVATFFTMNTNGNQNALAIVSMSVAFTAFLALVIYHILQIYQIKCCKIPSQNFMKISHRFQRFSNELENQEDKLDNDCPVELESIQTATVSDSSVTDPDRYITPPIIRSAVCDDQLREPALDVLSPVTPEDYK